MKTLFVFHYENFITSIIVVLNFLWLNKYNNALAGSFIKSSFKHFATSNENLLILNPLETKHCCNKFTIFVNN